MSLRELSNRVKSENASSVLYYNSLEWGPPVGTNFNENCKQVIEESKGKTLSIERKKAILNTLTENSDVFEYVALQSEEDWFVFDKYNTINGMLRLPDNVKIPLAADVLGNDVPVSDELYDAVMNSLDSLGYVDPTIFTEYSSIRPTQISGEIHASNEVTNFYNLPWGQISLYSSLFDEMMDIPVFPEEYNDSRSADYDTMPEIIYNYEPWYTYKSSGPRTCAYTFKLHRDMWSGDHNDGQCVKLISFCKANCYPRYMGSTVSTSTVTLYIAGKPRITGIMTECSEQWSGPLGHDNMPLYVEMTIKITEVATQVLDYATVAGLDILS